MAFRKLTMRFTFGIAAVVSLGVAVSGCARVQPQSCASCPPPGVPYTQPPAGRPPAQPSTPSYPGVAPTASTAAACSSLHEGSNAGFMVDGVPRTFLLTLPPGTDGAMRRWPVVFNWHGFQDAAANVAPLLADQARSTGFPFILVTPEDTNLLPTTAPIGFDWDILVVTAMNREVRLFDEVLGCLDWRFGVDRERIYSVGFSAGSIASNMLGVLRGDQLAAIATFSGGYFSNPANPPTLGLLAVAVRWPPLTTTNRYTQLLVHGGPTDQYSLLIAAAHFDQLGTNDTRYLNRLGHDVIHCDHGGPHAIPSQILGPQLVEFFAAHPRGMRSAWATALPADYPSYCRFSPHEPSM
jgi:hypothetical protein